jgi:hypothetical protein
MPSARGRSYFARIRVKRPGPEADHSTPSSADVKNVAATPPLHSAQLFKYKANFAFTFATHLQISFIYNLAVIYEQISYEI